LRGETRSSAKKAIIGNAAAFRIAAFLFMVAKCWFVTWPLLQVVAGRSEDAVYMGVNVPSPLSKGLFNRAIIESSPAVIWTFPTAAIALSIGTSFAIAAGWPGSDAAVAHCLRNLSTARTLQLQGTPMQLVRTR